jgi:hypothetical protein
MLRIVFLLGFLLANPAVLAQENEEEVPEAPFQLEATTDYEGATCIAVLKWRDMSDNELGFEILRSQNKEEFKVVGMVGANTSRYRDKVGKYLAGAYTYKVRAFNQAGKSEESNAVSVWF